MSTRKFQTGDTVIVTEKITKWNQSKGAKVGMTGIVTGYNYGGTYSVKLENGLNVQEQSNAFTKGTPKTSIEMFQEQIEKAEAKIAATKAFIEETQNKISFMQETGSDTFDQNEFKAYHTLTIIEQSDMSKIEKAKAIAALIAGK
jgi:hypothetical protein